MSCLYVIATPIGNLSDISERCLEILRSADLVGCEDTRHTALLLNHFEIKKPLISCHKFNETGRSEEIIKRMTENDIDVALVSDAGTPCISDPGYILVKAARQNGINVIGIPGPSAAVTALSMSGFDIDFFTFIGFLSREKKERESILEEIKKSNIKIFIFYESPVRITATLKELSDRFPQGEVCVCNDITKKFERSYWGKIGNVINEIMQNENHEKGEYTIVFNKNEIFEEQVNAEEFSIEAKLVDIMIKNGGTLKEAVEILNRKLIDVSKKEIYNASLNFKKKFELY